MGDKLAEDLWASSCNKRKKPPKSKDPSTIYKIVSTGTLTSIMSYQTSTNETRSSSISARPPTKGLVIRSVMIRRVRRFRWDNDFLLWVQDAKVLDSIISALQMIFCYSDFCKDEIQSINMTLSDFSFF